GGTWRRRAPPAKAGRPAPRYPWRGQLGGREHAAALPDRKRAQREHVHAVPLIVMEHPRHRDAIQADAFEPGERGALRPDQVAGEGIEPDLDETGRFPGRGVQLEHWLAVGACGPEADAYPDVGREHGLEVGLYALGLRRRGHPDP